MNPQTHPHGLTLVEVVVALIVLVLLTAILLPALGAARRSSQSAASNTQLREIQQALSTFAQTNATGGNGGLYPGLDPSGTVIPDGPLTGHSGDGSVPGARLWMMLNGHFLTPRHLINPADHHATELAVVAGAPIPPVTPDNFSYALQSLAGPADDRALWSDVQLTGTPILGDRAIGSGPANISSVWTQPGSGDWRGSIVRSDNSTGFLSNPQVETQLATQPDDLFEDDPATADAFLVHDDATTAYSAN